MSFSFDLHCHTTASDGIFPPHRLVREAHRKGIVLLSVTDHDTVVGLEEAMEEGRRLGLKIIPGVEVTAYADNLEVHILGHFIDPYYPSFLSFLANSQQARIDRIKEMIAKLAELGIIVDPEEVLKLGSHGSVGRPHLAQVLVKHGYIGSVQEAFDVYLGRGALAYVERPYLAAEEVMAKIKAAGGFPTLAHPGIYKRDETIGMLAAKGLIGLEVYHPDHNPLQIARYARLAEDYGLLATGGSDYHGLAGLHSPQLGVSFLRERDRRRLWEQVVHLCRLGGMDLDHQEGSRRLNV